MALTNLKTMRGSKAVITEERVVDTRYANIGFELEVDEGHVLHQFADEDGKIFINVGGIGLSSLVRILASEEKKYSPRNEDWNALVETKVSLIKKVIEALEGLEPGSASITKLNVELRAGMPKTTSKEVRTDVTFDIF